MLKPKKELMFDKEREFQNPHELLVKSSDVCPKC